MNAVLVCSSVWHFVMVLTQATKYWEWLVALPFACPTTGLGAWIGGTGITGALGAGVGGAIGCVIHNDMGLKVALKYHINSTVRSRCV